jgi:NADPH:quinone reductase-like Zn-dependent oxidoreductase
MGAQVTAVASADNLDLLTALGAERVLDYRATDPSSGDATFDVVLDPAGVSSFEDAQRVLTPKGVYVALNFSVMDALRALLSRLGNGPTMRIGVSGDTRKDLDELAALIDKGQLRPVIDRILPLEQIRDAYAHVEGRHRRGSVVLNVSPTAMAAE